VVGKGGHGGGNRWWDGWGNLGEKLG